jgi:hypothetical protein
MCSVAPSGIYRLCMAGRSLLPISMETEQDPWEPVLLMAFMILLLAKLCLSYAFQRSYSMFVCDGTQKERVGHCRVVGEEGRSDLLSA